MSTETPQPGRDSVAAARLQILATEHWSLLATRSLTYTEALGRVTIFLAILSGAVIALALVAQADHFGMTFIAIAIPLLSIVLFTGIATIARLSLLNRDDYRWVVAMNRIRNAYLALHPELEPHFTTSGYDDLHGVLRTVGVDETGDSRGPNSLMHLIQTLPGMVTLIVAAVGGAIGALAAFAVALPPLVAVVAAAVAFVIVFVWLGIWGQRSAYRMSPSLEPRFPTPVP